MSNSSMVTKSPVRMSYCYLLEPRKNDDGSDGKYGAMLIIPKGETATVKQINEAIDAARKAAQAKGMKNAQSLKSPLRDGDGERPNGGEYGPECKGCWVMNATSKRKPGIVNRRVQPILDPAEIYSGMWGIVDLNFSAYDFNGNRGISAYLNNVQKVRDDEALGGSAARPESVFSAVEDEDDDLGL